jgi:hypothetical protein
LNADRTDGFVATVSAPAMINGAENVASFAHEGHAAAHGSNDEQRGASSYRESVAGWESGGDVAGANDGVATSLFVQEP